MSGRYNLRSGCLKAPVVLILLLSSATSILAYSVPPSRENSPNWFLEEDASYQLAEQVISLLGPSHEQATAALDGVGQDGELYESVSEILLSGEEAATEAFALFSEGSYESAIKLAMKAMHLYGEAVRMATEPGRDGEDAAEEEAMKSIELSGEIERGLFYLDKVRKTVTQLGKKGYDISDYMALIEEAEGHLLLAEEMLAGEDVEGTEAEESAAMEILDEVMELLREESEESKAEKASKFLEKTEERLDKLEDRITDKFGEQTDFDPEKASIHQAFQSAQNLNQVIKSMIEAGEIDIALGQFKKVLEGEDMIWGLVESLDENFAENLKEEDEDDDVKDEDDDVKDEDDDVKDEDDDVKDKDDDVKDKEKPKRDQDKQGENEQ